MIIRRAKYIQLVQLFHWSLVAEKIICKLLEFGALVNILC